MFRPLQDWRWGWVLLIATVLAYQPAWNGQPIWDDAAHLTYPHLRSLTGLGRIWTEPGVMQQYYPVTFTVFWLEDKLWGHATLGYHLINILLHATAAFLLLKSLRALQIPAAGLAAAIFALHPIEVESVAWISELKNTLSTVFYLSSALTYLRYDETRSRKAYAGALGLFVLGLLAKTVTATLPGALLVVFWWQRGKLSWKRDVLPLVPFFVMGLIAGIFTSRMESADNGAHGAAFNFSMVERCLIAGRAFWFYLGKLFWPADLMFSYPRWKISPSVWWEYLYPAAAVLLVVALWLIRRWRRGPLAALLFFIGTLLPALGFINVYPFLYSFVADHFQYVAGFGPIVAASVGIDALFRRCGERRKVWASVGCALLLATLGLLTWRQCRMYSDMETLWRTTLARNPDSWLAQGDLGALLFDKGRTDQAIALFRSSLALRPENPEAHNNLATALDKKGEINEAAAEFRQALALQPGLAEAHHNYGNTLLRMGRLDEAIAELQKAVALRPDLVKFHSSLAGALVQKGELDEALVQFEKAVELEPDNSQTHFNLGCALGQEGRWDEAIEQFQRTVVLQPDFPEAENNLAHGLLRKGQAGEAVTHLRKALALRPGYGQARYNLAKALLQEGQVDEAIAEFQKILAAEPNLQEAQKELAGLAWRLATSANPAQRNGAKALSLAQHLDELNHGTNPMMAEILAAACAEQGVFDQAVENARRALQLAAHQNNAALAASLQAQLDCYQNGKPFREGGK